MVLTREEIMNLKSNSNAIKIHVNTLGPSLVPKLIMECNNADYWHKFVVENAGMYERDFILRTIIDFVHPADIIPVNFVGKVQASFLARNCLDALLKLTSNKLVVPNPLCPDVPLRLTIIANHYPAHQLKYDFENEIKNILKKRFNSNSRLLNLHEFHKDEDLKDFFPLSQPKLFLYVLQFAVELRPQSLALGNNFIKVINPIRVLNGCKITSINLCNNEIARMEDLEPLKDFKELQKLKVTGNPLCKGWTPDDYANKLRVMFPSLLAVDKFSLKYRNQPKLKTNMQTPKNFLCSTDGRYLVSQFLEHFFMAYDSENRQKIAPLYDERAMFSVTCRIIPFQKSHQNIEFDHYRCKDRNMKDSDEFSHQYLFRGREAIMNVFASFPRSDHDPFGFHCDLIYYTEVQAILVVNGIFRENKRYVGFARNFVLKCEDNAYTITNDQLHVYNALDLQVKRSDSHPLRVEISSNPLPFYAHQYTELQQAVHEITNLNYDYSLRYLDACNYELKKTLETFVEMHLKDEVPPEAFIQIEQKGLLGENSLSSKPVYPPSLMAKTSLKHPVIAPRTVWQTLKDDRLAAGYKIANNNTNKDVLDAEAEQIKGKILKTLPSNSTDQTISKQQLKMARRAPWIQQLLNPNKKFKASQGGSNNQQAKASNSSFQPNGQTKGKMLTAAPSNSIPVQMSKSKQKKLMRADKRGVWLFSGSQQGKRFKPNGAPNQQTNVPNPSILPNAAMAQGIKPTPAYFSSNPVYYNLQQNKSATGVQRNNIQGPRN